MEKVCVAWPYTETLIEIVIKLLISPLRSVILSRIVVELRE
jgi:hypothetical protein